MIVAYLIVGLLYWGLNSFVRKLDTDGDWLLPIVWFFAWPLAAVSWFLILIDKAFNYLITKASKNQL